RLSLEPRARRGVSSAAHPVKPWHSNLVSVRDGSEFGGRFAGSFFWNRLNRSRAISSRYRPGSLLSLSAMITRRDLMAIGAGAALATRAKGESATMPDFAKFDQRLSVLTLGVKDMAASRKFYVDGLGWKPAFENNDIIFFQTGGMVFALFARDQLAADFDADPSSFGRPPC